MMWNPINKVYSIKVKQELWKIVSELEAEIAVFKIFN